MNAPSGLIRNLTIFIFSRVNVNSLSSRYVLDGFLHGTAEHGFLNIVACMTHSFLATKLQC